MLPLAWTKASGVLRLLSGLMPDHGLRGGSCDRCSNRHRRGPGRRVAHYRESGWPTTTAAADRPRAPARRGAPRRYSACISASKQLSAAWWRVADRLREEGSTAEQWQAESTEAHAAWAPFSAAVAAVTVAGPGVVAAAAETLRQAMYELDMAGVAWHEAARREGHGRLEAFDARYMRAVNAKRAPGNDFQTAARKALNAEA